MTKTRRRPTNVTATIAAPAVEDQTLPFGDTSFQTYIGSIEDFGVAYAVFCRVSFDGVEFVGRLWFAEPGRPQLGIPDRSSFPGRTRDEVLALARRLTPEELALRYRRAFGERRRYIRLRRLTDVILEKIRYLNQVAISRDGGILTEENTQHEFELTERELHDCVDQLRTSAGVVGP